MGQIFDEKQVGAACAAILASSSVEELVLKLETQREQQQQQQRLGVFLAAAAFAARCRAQLHGEGLQVLQAPASAAAAL